MKGSPWKAGWLHATGQSGSCLWGCLPIGRYALKSIVAGELTAHRCLQAPPQKPSDLDDWRESFYALSGSKPV